MVEQITMSGVVISAMPISEYDKRLVILTKERGKVTAFARGARKQTSSLLAGSQPMTFGEFTMIQGRNAYTLTCVKVTKYFSGDMTDIEKMAYGMYFTEIVDYFGRENMEASDMLNLLYLSMKALLNQTIPDNLIRIIFELRAMVINGEYPNVFSCMNCKDELNLNAFDIHANGMLCSNCHGSGNRFIYVDNSTIYTLQYIVTAPLSKLYTFNVTGEVLQKMEQIITPYFNKIVDREFKSLEFLENSY